MATVVCHKCGHKEYVGALFCSECGSQLVQYQGQSTILQQKTGRTDDLFVDSQTSGSQEQQVFHIEKATVTLRFSETGRSLPLIGKGKFTVGRISKGQPLQPDIDLTEFKGYERGVSRLHALVKIEEAQVTITDLESSNGTFVNGERLVPHTPRRLNDGDAIALAKLRCQVVIRQ